MRIIFLISDCMDLQADICLCWVHMYEGTFSHIVFHSYINIFFDTEHQIIDEIKLL